MKYAVVTTFHKRGYELYGKRMIQSFLQNWPKDITLFVYHEDVIPTESASNLVLRDLNSSSLDLVAFKNKWKNDPNARGNVEDSTQRVIRNKKEKKGFQWDAIRFSHKVYAIFHCAKNCDADILFWMDADTVCHSPISIEVINKMAGNCEIGYLGRTNKYTECGLYSMDLRSPTVRQFLDKFQWVWDNAEQGIFQMKEWHDSYVFDQIRVQFPLKEYNWSAGIIEGEGHPLVNCAWGAYLDHLKGEDRKKLGRSKSTDLKKPRSESYWRPRF